MIQKKTSALEVQLIESTQRANQLGEENRKLVSTVHKLQKDNNRLESLKKAVLNSIQDDHATEDIDGQKVYCADDILQKSAPRTMQEITGCGSSDYLGAWHSGAFNGFGSSGSLLDAQQVGGGPGGSPQQHRLLNSDGHIQNGDGRTVDGKAFFRAARSVLTSDQFSLFLSTIKKLNQHRISREEALKAAQQIFGEQGADLYKDFKAMLGRHV
eukprot:GHVQ01018837.1.p1 GENE.GHVQ01018837.1~~GHVQ01018837.1.p1  ORF type:complete len:213 (-),score=35.70 GHVQ01018837.1:1120-1758(-)